MVAAHSGRTVTPGRASTGVRTSQALPPRPGLRASRRQSEILSPTKLTPEDYRNTMLELERLARSSKFKPLQRPKYLTRKSSRLLLVGLLQVQSRTWAAGVRTTYSCHRE